MSGTNEILRLADSDDLAGEISEVSAVRSGRDKVITAVRAGNGKLKLISWKISQDGSITRLADSDNREYHLSAPILLFQ